jgi:hypothetical protein
MYAGANMGHPSETEDHRCEIEPHSAYDDFGGGLLLQLR